MYYISQLINGLGIGSIYALIALGYSMVYGIIKLINFAHGEIIMVGGYTILVVLSMHLPLPLAVIGSVLFCVITGLVIQRVAYQRLLNQSAPKISLLITAIGVSTFLQNVYQLKFGSEEHTLPPMLDLKSVDWAGVAIPLKTFLNIGVTISMMIGLYFLVNKTRMGKAMRATSEDSEAAQLMGINTNHTIAFTFGVGSALAGVAAFLYTNTYPVVSPTMGGMFGLKAFVAAVLGGIGNIQGAMLGGFLIGLLESIVTVFGLSELVDAVVFGILIVILLIRPNGLLGKTVKEKV